MEELLEITTWSQLSIHNKPVILFNMKGYFEHLLKFIEHSVQGTRHEYRFPEMSDKGSAQHPLVSFSVDSYFFISFFTTPPARGSREIHCRLERERDRGWRDGCGGFG